MSGGVKFQATERKSLRMTSPVHAQAGEGAFRMSVFLDNMTGDVLYPVEIESVTTGLVFVLDTESTSSCSFPPSAPESMMASISDTISTFHDVVDAARAFIAEEQGSFKKTIEK